MRLGKHQYLLYLLEDFRHDASPRPFLLRTAPRSQSLRDDEAQFSIHCPQSLYASTKGYTCDYLGDAIYPAESVAPVQCPAQMVVEGGKARKQLGGLIPVKGASVGVRLPGSKG